MHTQIKMRTQKQIEAARNNGKKSRGPVTPQGKTIAARNSFKHGLTAATTTVDADLSHLIASHLEIIGEEYDLSTSPARAAARSLATARARASRAAALQHSLLNGEVAKQLAAVPEGAATDISTLLFHAHFSNSAASRHLQLLADYEGRAYSMQFRAENYLDKTCLKSAGMKTNPAKSLKSLPRASGSKTRMTTFIDA